MATLPRSTEHSFFPRGLSSVFSCSSILLSISVSMRLTKKLATLAILLMSPPLGASFERRDVRFRDLLVGRSARTAA